MDSLVTISMIPLAGGPMRVLIVGNGVAGVNVAAALRRLEPDSAKLSIDIYTEEPYDYYARIRLPEVFSGGIECQDLSMYKDSWYSDRAITVHKDAQVVAIDLAAHSLSLSDGACAAYDKLVLATGAAANRPALPGSDLGGVCVLRNYQDASSIRAWIKEGARSMAVLGGGLLGLEAAKHLKDAGLERVVVIEASSRLLPKQLDATGAQYVKKYLEGQGLEFRVGTMVTDFDGHGCLEALRLDSGEALEVNGALLSMGVKPRVELAQAAGLAVRRGVVVNEGLETSAAGVYAVGDCAEFEGVVWGIIPAALEQAPVAAARILGDAGQAYRQTVPRNVLKVAGLDLMSAGLSVPPEAELPGLCVITRENDVGPRYQKFVLKDGILVGAILLGDKKGQAWVTQRLGKAVGVDELPPLAT
jgi:nitrite reductase (NADH) large subunit